MTTRGLGPKDFDQVADFIDRAVDITVKIKKQLPPSSKLKDFKDLVGEDGSAFSEIADLKKSVVQFARQFPVIGFG
jgi:glycine hydroxymethyltransferase